MPSPTEGDEREKKYRDFFGTSACHNEMKDRAPEPTVL